MPESESGPGYGEAKVGPSGRKTSPWQVSFHWEGKRYRKSCRLKRQAEQLADRATETLRLLRRGVLNVPPDADVKVFVLGGGVVADAPARRKAVPRGMNEVLDRFLEARVPPAVAAR